MPKPLSDGQKDARAESVDAPTDDTAASSGHRQGGSVEFAAVTKRFWKGAAPVDALRAVTLTVNPGDFVGLVGPSGCGKSTLLNMAAGLLRPSTGEVTYNGEPISEVNTEVGYLTQKDNLIPWRTVVNNIRLPLEIRGYSRAQRAELCDRYIDLVGLRGFESHYPAELSGGMRKRVALATTLVYDPATLLMDEPFGALDAQLKLVLHQELLDIWHDTGKTIIFVTHDLAEAVSLCDRVVVMSARPGQVKRTQTIDMPHPRNLGAMRFDPHFQELFERLWSALSEDMLQGDEVRTRGQRATTPDREE